MVRSSSLAMLNTFRLNAGLLRIAALVKVIIAQRDVPL